MESAKAVSVAAASNAIAVQLQDVNARIASLTDELAALQARADSLASTAKFLSTTTDPDVLTALDNVAYASKGNS